MHTETPNKEGLQREVKNTSWGICKEMIRSVKYRYYTGLSHYHTQFLALKDLADKYQIQILEEVEELISGLSLASRDVKSATSQLEVFFLTHPTYHQHKSVLYFL